MISIADWLPPALVGMRQAGFTNVERPDGRFYQPVLVGNREA